MSLWIGEPASMSRSNRIFVFAYALLVILPLVGLAGILKSGRSLTAPVSIDGVWLFQVDSAQLDSLPCGRVLATIPDKMIAISQSGRSFVISSHGGPRVTGSGTLDGSKLRASFIPPPESSFGSDCGGGRQLSLLATVDRKADSTSLVGTLWVTHCSTCASMAFRAERQAPVISKEGQ
jgi:hypothetical protein